MTNLFLSPAECAVLSGLNVYPRSVSIAGEAVYFLGRDDSGCRRLGIIQPADDQAEVSNLRLVSARTVSFDGRALTVRLCPADSVHAALLRRVFPHLNPQPLGLCLSAGLGDRLGLATPGHVRAVQGSGIAPVFAQQSIRENARTGRTPQQVLDDAMWGLFQEGWRAPWGADADHLKTTADIDVCAAAGYTLYTIDPGDHVDNAAQTASLSDLRARFEALPWDTLEDTPSALRARYLGHTLTFDVLTPDVLTPDVLTFDDLTLARAAAKYGRAIAHVVQMARHLADVMGDRPYEVEVSVDETETPTSPAEHVYIATELRRLGVRWISLAPRFVGRFEKGVDYIGDLTAFEAEFARHAQIAWQMGPYKLSLHSGSDKFSIYPIAARHAGALIHLKTAGTSYLEALRALAGSDPAFFREILALARPRYEADRATYHVSADLGRVPPPEALHEDELPALLDDFHARQVLHVTFGSVMAACGPRLRAALDQHEEAYWAALETHLRRHLASFATTT